MTDPYQQPCSIEDELARVTENNHQLGVDLRYTQSRAQAWQRNTVYMLIVALISISMLVLLPLFAVLRAPLSANTRGAAREFCKALAEQDAEESKQP